MPGRASTSLAALPAFLITLLPLPDATAELLVTEGTNLAVDVSPADGRIAMDLLGSIWVLPARGGAAVRLTAEGQTAARPRWSADGEQILYESATATGSRLRVHDLATSSSRTLGDGGHLNQHPAWHPEGQRIVFSSDRRDTGFDLWEMDLPTGLSWRLTHQAGDETEPTWSPDGRHLAYIRKVEEQWRLVLRRRGQAAIDLVVSDDPLAAPAWRPDGTLLTFLRRDEKRYSLDMAILSEPPIIRTLAENQDFFLSPVAWIDRLRFLYAADGVIKSRGINDWSAAEVDFKATVDLPASGAATAVAARELPVVSPPRNRLVIRAARLFDGVQPNYRGEVDVVIDGGVIAEVGPRRNRDDATVLDLGDVTVLPGFVDLYATLPEGNPRQIGLRLLTFGITTVVAEGGPDFDADTWEHEQSPGPRLLRAASIETADAEDESTRWWLVTIPDAAADPDHQQRLVQSWQERGMPVLAESFSIGRRVGADLSVGSAILPESPLGRRYEDLRLTAGAGPVTRVSGLADAATPGMADLLQSRQAQALERRPELLRRYSEPPTLYGAASSVVAGSKPSGLPAGLALHAELRALAAAGFSGVETLQAAGANAAGALGLRGQLGRVATGALADLVLVNGDPLEQVEDALDIVAVVRNGRFYSLVRLLEEAEEAATVE